MSMGKYTCNSQTTSEGSESTLLEAFLIARLCHRLNAERKSPVEWQPSFEVDNDVS